MGDIFDGDVMGGPPAENCGPGCLRYNDLTSEEFTKLSKTFHSIERIERDIIKVSQSG